ncbi:MAG: response regulator transcription factor [Haloferacaceae archaeon]
MTDETATVLIVEDERALADLFSNWLDDEFAVRTAYDGEEALEKFDGDVDVVLLDRRMPGLSGDDVLERIRKRGIDCRVVMVTAVAPDFDIIDMGFDEYLVKPVDRSTMVDTVERMLSRSTYSDQLQDLQSLIAKRAALQSEKDEAELRESDEFADLEARIERLEADIDATLAEFEDSDFEAAFRDLGGDGVGE